MNLKSSIFFIAFLLPLIIKSSQIVPLEENYDTMNLFEDEENHVIPEQFNLEDAILSDNVESFNNMLLLADVNEVFSSGMTPLLAALKLENPTSCIFYIKKLLIAGAKPFLEIRNPSGRTFIMETFHYKSPTMEFINFMKKTFFDHWTLDYYILKYAIEAENIKLIFILIEETDFVIDDYFLSVYCDVYQYPSIRVYLNDKYGKNDIVKELFRCIEDLNFHTAIRRGNRLAIKIYIKFLGNAL